MMIALVAMFVMTMSVNAQSYNNSNVTFDNVASYLELSVSQWEPVKTAMTQFGSSMEALTQVKDSAKLAEAWDKIRSRHMDKMKSLLSEEQFEKYTETFENTVQHRTEAIMDMAQNKQ